MAAGHHWEKPRDKNRSVIPQCQPAITWWRRKAQASTVAIEIISGRYCPPFHNADTSMAPFHNTDTNTATFHNKETPIVTIIQCRH